MFKFRNVPKWILYRTWTLVFLMAGLGVRLNGFSLGIHYNASVVSLHLKGEASKLEMSSVTLTRWPGTGLGGLGYHGAAALGKVTTILYLIPSAGNQLGLIRLHAGAGRTGVNMGSPRKVRVKVVPIL